MDSQLATIELDHRMLDLFIRQQSTQSERTAKTYHGTIVAFMSHIAKPLAHVTLSDMQDYAESLSHLAPTTQNRMLSTIKSFYKFLHSQPPYNTLPNAVAVYKLPKMKQVQEIERVLTKEEVESIRNVLRYRNRRDWTIISFLFATGCRIDEALSARWCDIVSDFDGNVGVNVVGKGNKQRTVKLTPQMFTILLDYRKSIGMSNTIGDGDATPLFINRQGTRLTASYVERAFKKAVHLAGVSKDATPHWMRHSHATQALYNGADVFKVKESLGHSSIQTSMRYLHTINKLQSTTSDYVTLD